MAAGYCGHRDAGAGAVAGGSVAGGGRVAVLTGAAAEAGGGVVVAGAGGVADPHAAHRQASSRQLPAAIRGFAPILRDAAD